MKFSQEFEVAASHERVWELFHDVPSVVQCVPGAEILGPGAEPNSYRGQLSTKLGPIAIKFEGNGGVTFDEENRKFTIQCVGVDRRGGSRANGTVFGSVVSADNGTRVVMDSELTLSGAAAQFGRTGLLNDISTRMLQEFAKGVEAKINASSKEASQEIAAAPAQGLSVLFAALWARIRSLFDRSSRRVRGAR